MVAATSLERRRHEREARKYRNRFLFAGAVWLSVLSLIEYLGGVKGWPIRIGSYIGGALIGSAIYLQVRMLVMLWPRKR